MTRLEKLLSRPADQTLPADRQIMKSRDDRQSSGKVNTNLDKKRSDEGNLSLASDRGKDGSQLAASRCFPRRRGKQRAVTTYEDHQNGAAKNSSIPDQDESSKPPRQQAAAG